MPEDQRQADAGIDGPTAGLPALVNGKLQSDFINALGVLAAITGVGLGTAQVRSAWIVVDWVVLVLLAIALLATGALAARLWRTGDWRIPKRTLVSYAAILTAELAILGIGLGLLIWSGDIRAQIGALGALVAVQAFHHVLRLIAVRRLVKRSGAPRRRETVTIGLTVVGAAGVALGVWLSFFGFGAAGGITGTCGWIVAELGNGTDTLATFRKPRTGFDGHKRPHLTWWELVLTALRYVMITAACTLWLVTGSIEASTPPPAETEPIESIFAGLFDGLIAALSALANSTAVIMAAVGLLCGCVLAISNLVIKFRRNAGGSVASDAKIGAADDVDGMQDAPDPDDPRKRRRRKHRRAHRRERERREAAAAGR